jgi:hypothetical protein
MYYRLYQLNELSLKIICKIVTYIPIMKVSQYLSTITYMIGFLGASDYYCMVSS